MSHVGTFHIRIDPAKNRLYLSLQGHLPEAATLKAVDEIIACVSDLKPGFTMVSDVATFKPATPKGAEDIKQAQAFLARNGLGRAVRVVGDGYEPELARTGRLAGYLTDTAPSLAEAEALLDQVPA
jgi:hypothetical protein